MTEEFQVGVITSTHGIRGEVKVYPTTDDPARFKQLKTVTLNDRDGSRILHIRSVKFFKQYVILGFEEFNDINQVEGLKKAVLTVSREDAVPLDEDEYYVSDLIGIRCVDDTDEEIGILKEVMPTGANDVYVIEKDGRQILVPAIKDCIREVDMESGIMHIHLLEGLI